MIKCAIGDSAAKMISGPFLLLPPRSQMAQYGLRFAAIKSASQASVMTTSDIQSAFLGQGIRGPLGGLPTRIKEFLNNFELDQKQGGILEVFFVVLKSMHALLFLDLSFLLLSDSISVARVEISQSASDSHDEWRRVVDLPNYCAPKSIS